MKHSEIQIGHVYVVKVSGRLAPVRISYAKTCTAHGTYASASIHGSCYGKPKHMKKFVGVNERTGRTIGPFTAAKCRWEVEPHFTGHGTRVWRRVNKPEKGIIG